MAVRIAAQNDRHPPTRGVDRQSALLGRKVLVVDDSASQRRRLVEIFQGLGMKVVGEASHGLECLALAEKTNPDVISLDIIMPVMHGVETLGYLRDSKSSAVIIFVSVMGSLEVLAEIKAPGDHQPDAIFSKKDSAETIGDVLKSIFAGEEEVANVPEATAKEDKVPSSTGRAVS
jgi:chemotaxis response regulator CheB